MLEELGYRVRTAVLSVEETAPTALEQEALDLGDGEPVVRLERLRFDGDAPLIYSVDTFPRRFVPAPLKHLDWSGSLTSLLAAHGYLASSSAARLRAVELPEGPAARYGLDGVGPWLLVSETVITPDGTHLLYAEDYHRGDAFSFHVLRR
jgi:GntR family transcriptional regulator